MSSITFNARNHSASVRGPERYMMGDVCHRIAWIGYRSLSTKDVLRKGNPSHYIYQMAAAVEALPEDRQWGERTKFETSLETYIKVGDMGDSSLFPGADLFCVTLNTACRLGGPIVSLCARIHGQCEIHMWIDAADCGATADLIAEARKLGLFRAEMGWEAVIDMLRLPDVGDVVLSYSVTESFPGEHIALDDRLPALPTDERPWDQLTDEERQVRSDQWDTIAAAWGDFTQDEQWDAAMAGLRAKGQGLQFKPGADFGFNDGATAFDFLESVALKDITAPDVPTTGLRQVESNRGETIDISSSDD